MTFDPTKQYQTRDGRAARFLDYDPDYVWAHFEIALSGTNPPTGWYRALRYRNGGYLDTLQPHGNDIIPITATPEELALMKRMGQSNPTEFILILREIMR